MFVPLVAGACGTLEIEREPVTEMAEAAATATQAPLPTATEMPLPTPTEMPSPTPTRLAQDKKIIWDSEIISLDETWNRYVSNGQGFSIRFPKEMATFRGSCTWNEEQGSYRPQMALVPVKIFEDTDAVYIAPEHYYELAGERIEDNIHYYDACNQITNSLELLRDPENEFKEPFWKLVVAEIHDDAELDGFIKARYGSGCSLGEKEPSGQDGVYRVRIQGDGKAMEETQCLLNFGTVVKYYPAGNKVIAWDTGQAATFPADVNYSVIHDQEMIESFNFTGDAAVPPVASGETEVREEEVATTSEITALDETWNQYTNYQAGFSIKFPKMMMAFNGSCIWNEERGSYRYEMGLVPVDIFEDTDAVYIAGETFYALAGQREETTDDGGTRYFFEECNQVTNSLELLRDPESFHQQMWKLVVAEIRNEDDLDSFIKGRYGSSCSLSEQMASTQEGVYDVRIQGDGKSLEETECPLNYGTVVKYYPGGNTVVAWDTGQAYTFSADKTNSVTHDQEMVDSFEFITDAGSFMPAGASEEVADWWGVIGSTEPGAQFDDYFERQDLGQLIYFGIESRDPAVQAQIEALRDSGKVVHLYGTLLSNVPDYNGSQILVTRIEIDGTAVEPFEGWATCTNDDFGFTFQYPADWVPEVIPRKALDEGPGSPEWLADAIVLTKGKLVISIQHLRMSESVAWDGQLGGGGPYQEAQVERVTLIGQEARKSVWTYNDGIKAIEVQAVYQDADLALQIALYDASVEWVGDPVAETVPETAISVLDQILTSFALTQ